MDHVAIMKKSWGLTEKILSGKKTIESRWYMARCAPWGRIKAGETVYFKNSGESVKIKAKVAKVLQFADLNPKKVKEILEKYGKDDGISRGLGKHSFVRRESHKTVPTRPLVSYSVASLDSLTAYQLFKNKKYCLLIFLKNPVKIKPFQIDKTGFGSMSAWITIKNISEIKTPPYGF